ncbi:MAG: DUF1492 domain-containing protein [Clostridiales bacterium]|nr:DUF1492 domain-containing protein [Clostridiales bacterium]
MVSKDEYKTMVQRLKNLNKDLNGTGGDETDFFVKLCRLYEDKKVNLMEIYAKYYSGAKVTNTAFVPAGPSDMTDYMVHFTEGYDIFVKKIEKHYAELVQRRKEAMRLFTCMVSLPLSMSSVLYLTYFKRLEPDEVSDQLYMSRSTYYRTKQKAIQLLVIRCREQEANK